MKTLAEMVNNDPQKILELATTDPGLLDNVLIGQFSAQYIDAEGKKASLKRHWFLFARFFHLGLRSQVDCFLIERYKAQEVIKVTIHNDKSRPLHQRLKELY